MATAWLYGGPQGYAVLFARAIAVIHPLAAAKNAGRLKPERKKYTQPALLLLNELGDLPIDQSGADLLCQVISLRSEQGAVMITSHRAFQEWPKMFHNDSTLTAAILERLLHHAETVVIAGKSFRMRGQVEPSALLEGGCRHRHSPMPGGLIRLVGPRIFKPTVLIHFHATGNSDCVMRTRSLR